MLKNRLQKNIDASIDPMTAVAVGAALFASTISVSEEVKDEKVGIKPNYNLKSTTKPLNLIV